MKLNLSARCDVLVLGSGIAGISAALAAAEAGASVTLCCKGKLFSGSSFYPGTWGLGLIGPADKADEADLAATIQQVGCQMADDALVRALVEGVHPAIEKVRAMGVKLRRADNGAQKEFIPCFDHKHRDWNGLEFDSVRSVFSQKLQERNVTVLPGWEALELVKADGRVCGAILSDTKQLQYLGCGALVLATGGYGSLFRHHLCTGDVEGLGQALALDAGCRLVNMEFMQIMPGYLHPAYQTVFNEKTFRFTRLRKPDGEPLPGAQAAELLALRSGHGPFTSRLASREIDLAIYEACRQDPRGVEVTYTDEMKQDPPEFVKTYFDWLAQARGLTMDDPVWIGHFAHASNGGIWIKPDAQTGVPGLFAAGEVTGGMHGADRIGGLSTANGLVFGGKAGAAAAAFARNEPAPVPQEWTVPELGCPDSGHVLNEVQQIMFRSNMVVRSEEGLMQALRQTAQLQDALNVRPTQDAAEISGLYRIRSQLLTAGCILQASLLRRESRGSHYRADHPAQDPAMDRKICIQKTDGQVTVRFV